MAKVRQAQRRTAPQLLPEQPVPQAGRVNLETIRVQPTPINVNAGGREAVIGAALTGIGQVGMEFAKTQGRIQMKREAMVFEQAQAQSSAKARSDLMGVVTDTADAFQGDDLDFDKGVFSSALRENILNFVATEQGQFITNDTLRLALSEGDKLGESMTPKTQITLDGGKATVVQQLAGVFRIDTRVFDEDEAFIAAAGSLNSSHPTMIEALAQRTDLNNEEKVEQMETYTRMSGEIQERQLLEDFKNSRNPAFGKPKEVREALAQQAYFNTVVGHTNLNLSRLISPKFDTTVPGALMAVADELEADGSNFLFSDPAAGKLSEQYGVNVYNLIGEDVNKYVRLQADYVRSLDTMTSTKRGSGHAVAEMTKTTSLLKREQAIWEGNMPPSVQFFAKYGQNLQYASMYESMLRQNAQKVPSYKELLLTMKVAESRFKDMSAKIRNVPDDDTKEARRAVQDIVADFFVDATNWANRQELESGDIVGFVGVMNQMDEHGAFERLEPKNFKLLQQIYNEAKNQPGHIELFNAVESDSGIEQVILKAGLSNLEEMLKEE